MGFAPVAVLIVVMLSILWATIPLLLSRRIVIFLPHTFIITIHTNRLQRLKPRLYVSGFRYWILASVPALPLIVERRWRLLLCYLPLLQFIVKLVKTLCVLSRSRHRVVLFPFIQELTLSSVVSVAVQLFEGRTGKRRWTQIDVSGMNQLRL